MSDSKIHDDAVTCDRCNEVFIDEESYTSHT